MERAIGRQTLALRGSLDAARRADGSSNVDSESASAAVPPPGGVTALIARFFPYILGGTPASTRRRNLCGGAPSAS